MNNHITIERSSITGERLGKGAPCPKAQLVARSDIPIGKENAISREDLARKWGVSDRAARRIVERMRDEPPTEPFVIASTSHHTGYWRTNDPKELEHYEREVIARASTQFKRLQAVSAVRQMLSGQTRMAI